MTLTANKKHFNLYYIFKEDRAKHSLSDEAAKMLWNNILCATRKAGYDSDLSPPLD